MQKMLTSLPALAAPPVVRAPAGEPVSTIVRAPFDDVNAPAVCWPQLVKPDRLEQSAFEVHGTGRHGAATLHGTPVVPVLPLQAGPPTVPPQRWANVLSDLFLQKPQNTFG